MPRSCMRSPTRNPGPRLSSTRSDRLDRHARRHRRFLRRRVCIGSSALFSVAATAALPACGHALPRLGARAACRMSVPRPPFGYVVRHSSSSALGGCLRGGKIAAELVQRSAHRVQRWRSPSTAHRSVSRRAGTSPITGPTSTARRPARALGPAARGHRETRIRSSYQAREDLTPSVSRIARRVVVQRGDRRLHPGSGRLPCASADCSTRTPRRYRGCPSGCDPWLSSVTIARGRPPAGGGRDLRSIT